MRIKFKARTFKKKKRSGAFKINFYTDDGYKSYGKRIRTVREDSEKAQSIAIRLKTELGELQDFFSDFGCNKKLLAITDLYDKFGNSKIIKKNKIGELGLDEMIVRKYSSKETEKQYSQIDNLGLINELSKNIENKPLSIKEQIKHEQEFAVCKHGSRRVGL